ncbi:MAG: hypothetical protein DCC49_10070 [Acidobacteria bacterium]|nr:MAG: hypothetical protein DCC49_10070 [Acidobacteriota bacterium]
MTSGETICISCGAAAERNRARCLECGAPQRRLRLLGGRLPAGPILAIGVVLALMLAALVVMMVGDQKAGPSRAYGELRAAGSGGNCDETWDLLSDDAHRVYGGPGDACRIAASFDWAGATVLNVRVQGGQVALLCVAEPPGHGVFFQKIDGLWKADSAAPSLRSECLPEAPADAIGPLRPPIPDKLT